MRNEFNLHVGVNYEVHPRINTSCIEIKDEKNEIKPRFYGIYNKERLQLCYWGEPWGTSHSSEYGQSVCVSRLWQTVFVSFLV